MSTAAAGLITMLYVPYRNTVLEYNPDVIISTYPLYSAPATWWQIRREGLKSTEAAGIDVKLSMLHGSKKSNPIHHGCDRPLCRTQNLVQCLY